MNFRPSEADRGCCSYREGAVEVEVEDNRVVKTKRGEYRARETEGRRKGRSDARCVEEAEKRRKKKSS